MRSARTCEIVDDVAPGWSRGCTSSARRRSATGTPDAATSTSSPSPPSRPTDEDAGTIVTAHALLAERQPRAARRRAVRRLGRPRRRAGHRAAPPVGARRHRPPRRRVLRDQPGHVVHAGPLRARRPRPGARAAGHRPRHRGPHPLRRRQPAQLLGGARRAGARGGRGRRAARRGDCSSGARSARCACTTRRSPATSRPSAAPASTALLVARASSVRVIDAALVVRATRRRRRRRPGADARRGRPRRLGGRRRRRRRGPADVTHRVKTAGRAVKIAFRRTRRTRPAHPEAMCGRVLFTVAVLAVFIAAIVYTAFCARAAVAAEAEAGEDVRHRQRIGRPHHRPRRSGPWSPRPRQRHRPESDVPTTCVRAA